MTMTVSLAVWFASSSLLCVCSLSQVTLRRLVSILFVLYRHLHMYHSCRPPPAHRGNVVAVPQFETFHLSASMETFNRYTMHMDLPPAARLIYRQDFAGFYNCISQVAYFHFPSYERKDQLPLEKLRAGKYPIYALAPLMEMFPEIKLVYEDENMDASASSWHWMIMGYRIYLVSPGFADVFYSDDLIALALAAVAGQGLLEGDGVDDALEHVGEGV